MPKKERVKKTQSVEVPENSNTQSELHRRKAETWLWFGVIVVSAVMIIFWLISMKWEFSYLSSKKSEQRAVEQIQQNWNQIFSKNEDEEKLKENAKKDIKNVLDKIVSEQKTVSTTSSTTVLPIATTTTNTIKN